MALVGLVRHRTLVRGVEELEMIIDCDSCEMRNIACDDCVVSVLLAAPPAVAGGRHRARARTVRRAGVLADGGPGSAAPDAARPRIGSWTTPSLV